MRPRINTRMLVLVAAVALPLLWYGYVLADQLIYHGIKPHNGWIEVDLRTLGSFTFDPNTDGLEQVPARFRVLDGKRIVFRGIMYDTNSSRQTADHFQFVYNVQTCCFTGLPQVQERVFARCAPGKAVKYYDNQPVEMTGILHVKTVRDPEVGVVVAVYEMDVESVDPL